MSTIVIMPGGFHPFHAGHAALYNSARRAFPDADVYVAATNDTSNRPFPFAIKEKLAKLAGVEPGHFVQVKSPFQAREITAGFNPEVDRLIFVRSEKDANKPPQAGGVKKDGNPAYLQPLEGQDELAPMAQHAYMAYLPTVEFGPGMTSATEIRTAWPTLNEKRKTALVMSLYPKTQKNPALAANVVKMLDTAMGTEQGVAEGSLNEFAQSGDNRPDADYEVYLLDPKALRNKKLDIMGDPMFKSDNLAHACTFIYKYWNSTKQPICVFQPKRGYFRDYYMDPAVNWMDEYGNAKGVAEAGITRRGILKGIGAAAAAGAAGKAGAIAGAFPTPSHQAAMYKAAADSNAAQARADAAAKAKADAKRLQQGTQDVERLNRVNYHGGNSPKPTNATWDGDSDFLDLDGTQYTMASRMPISGNEPRDMKLIVTKEGHQVYIWTRYRMKGDGGHYFYPADNPKTIDEGFFGLGGPAVGAPLASTNDYNRLGGASKLRHDAHVALKMVDSLKHTNSNGRYDAEIITQLQRAQEYLAKAKEIEKQGVEEGFDREEFRRHMKDLEAREELRKRDPVSAKALDLRGQLPQQSKKRPEDDSIGINDPRHPGYAYTQAGQTDLNEFAPDEGGGSRKFIPWTEFIEQVKQIVSKDFSCKENVVKSTIKARFVPHDPMEYGPTMLYSYYETRAGGRNKGAVSTRGSIQVGKYTKGGLFGHTPDQLLTGFHLLKGHPFERHFDLTFDNIYKIANIIMGNTEGALEFKPEGVAEMDAQNMVGGMTASYQARENQPTNEDYLDE